MDFEVVVPKNNEIELAQMAEKLGFKEIIFLYEENKPKTIAFNGKIKVSTGFVAKSVNDLGAAAQKFTYLFGTCERQFFESRKLHYIICSPSSPLPDLFYQRRSDLDDASCILAKEREISLVFDVGTIKDTVALGRLSQNARLAKKHRLKVSLASFASGPLSLSAPKDLDCLGRIIGI